MCGCSAVGPGRHRSYGRPAPDRTCSRQLGEIDLRPPSTRLAGRSAQGCVAPAGRSCPWWRAGCGPLGTLLGHLAVRSMSPRRPAVASASERPDAIAALSVLVSLVLFFYTRSGRPGSETHPRSGPGLHGVHGLRPRADVPLGDACPAHYSDLARDLVDRRGRADVRRDRPEHAGRRRCSPASLAVSMNPIAMLIARARGASGTSRPRPTRC